ncbi:CHRD domain-containing protein [Deinococcus metallilatus]|nr:CHRD domain-containing protein [Deinococcus metallilatus]MBB5295664.1 hypothetical protein [Deinococcus metallilatus]
MTSLLSACTMMGQPKTFTFRHNPIAADPQAAGSAQVMTQAGGMVTTTLTLTGLTPGKTYAAHYHAFGPDSNTDPCASNGPVTVGFPSFTADAAGRASTTVTSEMAKIAGDQGAYINVHYGDDLKVVPVCAPLKMTKG